MAQTGFTPIQLYYSSTTTNVPTAGNLAAGELAINTADGLLFYKDSGGAVQLLSSKAHNAGALTAGGIQYGTGTDIATTAAGTTGQILVSGGANAPTWVSRAAGSVLLATLTPTASAAVNASTTFDSTYDAYMIVAEGIAPSADDTLQFRFAVAGSLDSGSNYYNTASNSNTPALLTATAGAVLAAQTGTAGKGASFVMYVQNTNDATNIKSARVIGITENTVANNFAVNSQGTAYVVANAITGIGFLWSSGSNFKAQGKVRIYGLSNT